MMMNRSSIERACRQLARGTPINESSEPSSVRQRPIASDCVYGAASADAPRPRDTLARGRGPKDPLRDLAVRAGQADLSYRPEISRPPVSGRVYELVRDEWLRVVGKDRAIRIPRDALAEWQHVPSPNEISSWISC
jgi:hypothetical protein